MKITNFTQFEKFLHSRIPTREALFMGDLGLRRAKYFMRLLGNPQNRLRVIHIAGTSGKGSTSYLMSHILRSQGFSVGLSISPHVLDIRERMQINNKLPSKKIVLEYFNEILPVILKMDNCKYGMPTFFEINVGLAYYMFAKAGLDYAVMETGLGGLLDATNTVSNKNKICIITKLGLDHTEILGKTIAQITAQKAGIIKKQNEVISIQQSAKALGVLRQACENKKSQLCIIDNNNFRIISHSPQKTVFDFTFNILRHHKSVCLVDRRASESGFVKNKIQNKVLNDRSVSVKIKNINLGLIGKHQAENCSLALASLAILSERDNFLIDEKGLRKSLENIDIPGRFEIHSVSGKTIIIDGAHNPQKMQALVGNLTEIYPNQKFTFIIAFKKNKDYEKMLLKILPIAERIYLTRFSVKNMDGQWSSTDNDTIAKFLKSQNFLNFSTISKMHFDISRPHGRHIKDSGMSENPVVITGSLYLVGEMHKYLFKKKITYKKD